MPLPSFTSPRLKNKNNNSETRKKGHPLPYRNTTMLIWALSRAGKGDKEQIHPMNRKGMENKPAQSYGEGGGLQCRHGPRVNT